MVYNYLSQEYLIEKKMIGTKLTTHYPWKTHIFSLNRAAIVKKKEVYLLTK